MAEKSVLLRYGHYDSDSHDTSQSQHHYRRYGSIASDGSNDEGFDEFNHSNVLKSIRGSNVNAIDLIDNLKPNFYDRRSGSFASQLHRDSFRDPSQRNNDSSSDEFDSYQLFANIIKTGRQRKKLAVRSRGGEFMLKRKKRRVYFCCLANEIDVERLNDMFSDGHMSMYGKLYIDVLYLFEKKDDQKLLNTTNSKIPNSTTEESEASMNRSIPIRRRSSNNSEYNPLETENINESTHEPTESAAKMWQTSGKEVYIFNFGAVVFWGYPKGEEARLLNEIRKFISSGELSQREFERCQDDMAYVVTPGETDISIANDVITCPEDANIKSRLSVSFAIAQSAVLALFEGRVDRKVQQYKYIPETLALSGAVKLPQNSLGNMLGDVLSIRHDVNLNTEIMSTPDFFWREDEAVVIYRMTMAYLEMETRTEVLNTRLNMLKDLLVALQKQSESVLAVQLEWVVIWLIIASIVLEGLMLIFHE